MSENALYRELEAYLDPDTVADALLKQDYTAAGEAVQTAISKIREEYRSGTLAEEDALRTANTLLAVLQYDLFCRAMEPLRTDLADTPEALSAMTAAYALFTEKGETDGSEWLWEIADDGSVAPAQAQKPAFFRAMQALALLPEDFDDTPPAGMPLPKTHAKIYGDCVLISIPDAEIVSDSGLRKHLNPIGKGFVLTDSDGCVYHLENLRRSEVPGGLDTEGARHYAADGYIEGYTSETAREIEFEISREGKYVFSFMEEPDDALGAQWAEYTAYSDRRSAARLDRLRALLAD